MRVAIITHRLLRTDGQGKINYELALRLSQRGVKVHLISSELTGPLASADGVFWHRVALPNRLPTRLRQDQWFAIGSALKLRQILPRPDITVVNGGITYAHADAGIAMFVHSHWRALNLPNESSRWSPWSIYQGLYTAINTRWERYAFRNAVASIALSQTVAEQLQTLLGLPFDRVHVIHPGVDFGTFKTLAMHEPIPLREELGLAPQERLAMFVGDLGTRRKNLELVLRGISNVCNMHLVVVGSTKRSPYPSIVEKMGLSERVSFLGRREDVESLVRQADVFCLPSRYDPWALVVTEALACGVPVVTSPETGASDLIIPGINGWMLRSADDYETMAKALAEISLLGTPQQKRQLVRASIIENTWERMADQYLELFRQLIQRGNALR